MDNTNSYMLIIISLSTFISMISILVGCLCCKKRVIKNELLGLEGLVKIKNPDDNNVNSVHSIVSVETKPTGPPPEVDIRRASAPHRSLPDIPSDPMGGDTNSELYATVGDKVQAKPQGRSPTSSLKKQASVSQHSSMSQADDVSSPYARVMSPPHAYDKVRHTEHPYAQLNSGSNNIIQATIDEHVNNHNTISRNDSNESLINIEESVEIPAGSAIAGRIAASQELPYMTPPIVQLPQQNFSGDSQDSSKGYTSISVREPLANIIAQTNQQNAKLRRRDISDSHYATVSDDSDEMYAAIDDPNNHGELYTSGSETYAQIQPPNALVTVSVEVNPIPASVRQSQEIALSVIPTSRISISTTSNPQKDDLTSATVQPVENLKANMHSRQASSSSCTSSMGNLGSPKPEKRQANSPLPPPPKNSSVQSHHLSNTNLSSSSGRNSVASLIEVHHSTIILNKSVSKENLTNNDQQTKQNRNGNNTDDNSNSVKKKQSPSKDLEGMYAKVMKKNKLSNLQSQNSSPILTRKPLNTDINTIETCLSDLDITNDCYIVDNNKNDSTPHNSPSKNSVKSVIIDNNYETIDRRRVRSNSYDHEPGYETIPGDKGNNNEINMNKSFGDFSQIKSRLSAPPAGSLAQGIHRVSQNTIEIFNEVEKYSSEPGYESLPDNKIILRNEPGYELISKSPVVNLQRTSSDYYDPNYEVLRPTTEKTKNLDDGYAKVTETRKEKVNELNDGYSSIKSVKKLEYNKRDLIDNMSGYSTVSENPIIEKEHDYSSIKEKTTKKNHDYASIKETTIKQLTLNNNINNNSNNNNSSNNNNNNIDEEVDILNIYSSIPNTTQVTPNYLDIVNVSNNYSTIDETIKQPHYSNIPDTPLLLSVNSTISSPVFSGLSDSKTTPSTDSNCSDIQMGYPNLQKSNNETMKQSTNNYESLTGGDSESDPNYESVKYLNIKENPYERLHNDENSISPDGLITNTNQKNNDNDDENTVKIVGPISNSNVAITTNDNLDVGDYFQV